MHRDMPESSPNPLLRILKSFPSSLPSPSLSLVTKGCRWRLPHPAPPYEFSAQGHLLHNNNIDPHHSTKMSTPINFTAAEWTHHSELPADMDKFIQDEELIVFDEDEDDEADDFFPADMEKFIADEDLVVFSARVAPPPRPRIAPSALASLPARRAVPAPLSNNTTSWHDDKWALLRIHAENESGTYYSYSAKPGVSFPLILHHPRQHHTASDGNETNENELGLQQQKRARQGPSPGPRRA